MSIQVSTVKEASFFPPFFEDRMDGGLLNGKKQIEKTWCLQTPVLLLGRFLLPKDPRLSFGRRTTNESFEVGEDVLRSINFFYLFFFAWLFPILW